MVARKALDLVGLGVHGVEVALVAHLLDGGEEAAAGPGRRAGADDGDAAGVEEEFEGMFGLWHYVKAPPRMVRRAAVTRQCGGEHG